ncbi:MAG TPA: FAD-dependent oxidoreductase, partial [Balneolales bacterium]|nr:FAD-dependent oxidoreductase [Balneolales bacterium]
MNIDYDVIILGSGPAGFSCAMQASKFGKRVLVVEQNENFLGGEAINSGTVPSKILREAANTIYRYNKHFAQNRKNKSYEHYLMDDLISFKNRVQINENKSITRSLQKNHVETIRGSGHLIDEHTIEVTQANGEKQSFTSDYILISTGSSSSDPQKYKIDNSKIFDSRSIVQINHIPRRLVIVGSGIDAIEYATTFGAMGTNVTLLNEDEHYVMFLDNEIRDELNKVFDQLRIYVHHRVDIQDVHFNPLRNYTEVRFNKEGSDELRVIETEHVLYLGSRLPNTRDIGAENAHITLDAEGFIPIDEHYKTEVDSVYAAGDVTGFPALASVSFSQGRLAACHMFNIPVSNSPAIIPFGIYSIPEISSIGLTEEEAKSEGINYAVGRTYFKNITRANIDNTELGLLKIVFN